MKTLITIILALVTSASVANAETKKPKKPVVCMNYAIAKTDAAHDDAVAICYDTKKPSLFRRFEVKEIPDSGTGRIKVLVGWR